MPSYMHNDRPLCCFCAGGAYFAAGQAEPSVDQSCSWLPGKGPRAEVYSSRGGCLPNRVHAAEGVVIEQHSWPTVWSVFEISMRSHGWDTGVHSVCIFVSSCKIIDCVLLLFASCHLFIVSCKVSTIQAIFACTPGVQLSWKQSFLCYFSG